jgi:assimilatory nitrate reductase catalytic subunit
MINATRTHCPYCAFQCGIRLSGAQVPAEADDFPVNRGRLCVKGWTSWEAIDHPDRLLRPLIRNARGVLAPATWDQALDYTAKRFKELQAEHGLDAVALFGSGALTNEKAYLLGKLARVALRTRAIDYNGRYCMASGAAANNLALGIDRGLPFPLSDVGETEVLLLAGANPAETMPPFMQWVEAMHERGGRMIVIDPRRTATAEVADVHLRLQPGTDGALANGLLHLLIREGFTDQRYLEERTEGFAQARAVAASYWPERVERLTGVPEKGLLEAARLLGEAKSAIVLTARGAEQQAQGVRNALAYLNLALATGRVGRPASGYGCLTGQGNGQGGREHGQKADQLPGYRKIDDPAARQHLAAVWGVDEASIPGKGKSAYELLESLGTEVHGLLVVGANVVVSSPNARLVEERIRSLKHLAVADFFFSETAAMADVVFPSAQWAEEEGTMTNLEGRVLHRRPVQRPPGEARSDLQLLCALGARLGHREKFSFAGPREVFEELGRATAGGLADYSGISYEKIDAHDGIYWPCPSAGHPGTPRLFEERFPTPSGKARFLASPHVAPVDDLDEAFPLYLTTGRVLAHYQTGVQTRRIGKLLAMSPGPTAQLHPHTARRFGVEHGAEVTLETRRGRAIFTARVSSDIRDDTIFVPFHWGGVRAVNRLTSPALDPTSRMPEFKVCAVRIIPEPEVVS